MECLIERNGDQRRGPDTVRGVDQKSSDQSSKTVAAKVGTDGSQDLVAESSGVRLVKVLRKILRNDNVGGVRGVESDSRHDGDEHVFLLVESSRVERVSLGLAHVKERHSTHRAKQVETPVRQYPIAQSTSRICYQHEGRQATHKPTAGRPRM